MGPTGPNARIVQIHPARRCNLRCKHCYSLSSPEIRDVLDAPLLAEAILDAAAEGYNVASFSGGEPLLYPRLLELLECAKSVGLVTSLVTNGTLLNKQRLKTLSRKVDFVAVSIDGGPRAHNLMRASESAFDHMQRGLSALREAGLPFGLLFTLTSTNLAELDWVVEFAARERARLVQIHPLEASGRALAEAMDVMPTEVDMTLVWLRVLDLRCLYQGVIDIQLDLVDVEGLRSEPSLVYGDPEYSMPDLSVPLGQLVTPLVIESDGTVVPLQYGLSRHLAIGSLHDRPLRELAAAWRTAGYGTFREVCRKTFEELSRLRDLPIVNWYEAVRRQTTTMGTAYLATPS